MKLHIDTENKIITLEAPVKIGELVVLLGMHDWDDFTLVDEGMLVRCPVISEVEFSQPEVKLEYVI